MIISVITNIDIDMKMNEKETLIYLLYVIWVII